MKFIRLILTFGLFLSSSVAAGNVFQVDRIKVDVSATSTTLARSTALQQGQERALAIAMRRLAKQEEWDKLPDIRTLDIENMVEVLRISDEKTGPTRYLATLSIQFKAAPLRDLLRSYGVAVTEVQSKPALLLPVLEDLQGLQAWVNPGAQNVGIIDAPPRQSMLMSSVTSFSSTSTSSSSCWSSARVGPRPRWWITMMMKPSLQP